MKTKRLLGTGSWELQSSTVTYARSRGNGHKWTNKDADPALLVAEIRKADPKQFPSDLPVVATFREYQLVKRRVTNVKVKEIEVP
ncbi:hypothetical protein R5W24_003331 [Gemmata sp. JC717]|uniref:hypothetical protein n=1 Tax=Gemmata algarum TaxID=2975278 RepID=UPI0021BB5745|nr:hypothetical protein [Gemmata algarum]MDY3554212.1 hypothetical protein [Gemmata algarum]